MAYSRTTPLGAKISLGVVSLLVTVSFGLFGMLLTGYRETQARLDSNFHTYADSNTAQHKELAERLEVIKSFLCSRYPNWKRCE